MSASQEPLLLSVRDASRALGLGRDATYRLVREGRLRSVRVGRRSLVPRSELESFVEREAVKHER
jgi:excisionase family DNA binding protein